MKKLLFILLVSIVPLVLKAQYPLTVAGYDNNSDSLIIPFGAILPAAVIDGKGTITKDVIATVGLVLRSDNNSNIRDVGLLINNGQTAENEKIGIVILGQYAVQNEVTGSMVNLSNDNSGTVRGYAAEVIGDTALGIKTTVLGTSAVSDIVGGEFNAMADTSIKSDTEAYGSVGVAIAGSPIGLLGSAQGISDTIENSVAVGVYGHGQKSKVNYGVAGIAAGGSPNIINSLSAGLYGYATGSQVNYAAYLDGDVYINGDIYGSPTTFANTSSKTRVTSNTQGTLARVNQLKIDKGYKEDNIHYSFRSDEFRSSFPELMREIPLIKNQDKQMEITETVTAINYSEMIPLLTRALQEQQEMIKELQESNKSLARKVNLLESTRPSGK